MFKKLPENQRHTKCLYCNYVGCTWKLEKYPTIGHWMWTFELTIKNIKKYFKTLVANVTNFDYARINNIEIDGIDHRDAPDYVNAFISYAEYKGKPMTEKQLDRLNNDRDFVYEKTIDYIY